MTSRGGLKQGGLKEGGLKGEGVILTLSSPSPSPKHFLSCLAWNYRRSFNAQHHILYLFGNIHFTTQKIDGQKLQRYLDQIQLEDRARNFNDQWYGTTKYIIIQVQLTSLKLLLRLSSSIVVFECLSEDNKKANIADIVCSFNFECQEC